MNELALFAGAGGGLLASRLLGWNTVGACEIAEYPRSILLQRQQDGFLDKFPIWDDVRTFDGRPWRGKVDIISGGFPCQDVSSASTGPRGKGKGGEGISGSRSGLWSEYRRVIGEARPCHVFAENSPRLRTRGLGTVIRDLAQLGYDSRWCVLGGRHVGAYHQRNRMWILASDSQCDRIQGHVQEKIQEQPTLPWEQDMRGIEDFRKRSGVPFPGLLRGSNGLANYVDRIKAIGNGQIPAVAATAFRILSQGLI